MDKESLEKAKKLSWEIELLEQDIKSAQDGMCIGYIKSCGSSYTSPEDRFDFFNEGYPKKILKDATSKVIEAFEAKLAAAKKEFEEL